MIRWICQFTLNETKKHAELIELLTLEPVSQVITKGGLRLFGNNKNHVHGFPLHDDGDTWNKIDGTSDKDFVG